MIVKTGALIVTGIVFTGCSEFVMLSEADWIRQNQLVSANWSENLLENGDFSTAEVIEHDGDSQIIGNGWFYYNKYSNVTAQITSGRAEIQVTGSTLDRWDPAFNYGLESMELGKKYRLEFTASSQLPGAVITPVIYAYGTPVVDRHFISRDLTITDVPQNFTFEFTALSSVNHPNSNIFVCFELGNNSDTTFYFDDVSLQVWRD